MAEMTRVASNFKAVHFVFTLGEGRGFRMMTPKDHSVPNDERHWRIRQILIPSCWLLRSCSGVNLFEDRAEFELFFNSLSPNQIFPNGYTLEQPSAWVTPRLVKIGFENTSVSPLVFSATQAGLKYVDRWLARNKLDVSNLVCLTLRNAQIETFRNANMESWLEFARVISWEGYQPVIVPDTEEVLEATLEDYQSEFPVFWPGPVNLELRAALYQRAKICMSDNGAAAFIHQFMPESNSVVFQPPSKIPEGLKTVERQEGVLGIKRGEQFPFFTSNQWYCWEDDSFDVILGEFRKLEGAIKAKQADGS